MKNSTVPNDSQTFKQGNSLSYTAYTTSEVITPVLTDDEVKIFRYTFEKHSKDRALKTVPPHLDCEGKLVDHFSHVTLNRTYLEKHSVIDPSVSCNFSDEEALALAASSTDSLENSRSETLKDLTKFYWYYLNNIDKKILKHQESPIKDFTPPVKSEPARQSLEPCL